jgi:hypothetical protein
MHALKVNKVGFTTVHHNFTGKNFSFIIWNYVRVEIKAVKKQARFEVLTSASIKMASFWHVTPCNLV